MRRKIRAFLGGMARVLDLGATIARRRGTAQPVDGLDRDAANLAGDWLRVGNDLRKAVARAIEITTDRDHQSALDRIDQLMGSDDRRDRIEIDDLASAVEAYENERWPIGQATEEEIKEFTRDQSME